jgi:hypothetical protein
MKKNRMTNVPGYCMHVSNQPASQQAAQPTLKRRLEALHKHKRTRREEEKRG